jgi:hypothetical protein
MRIGERSPLSQKTGGFRHHVPVARRQKCLTALPATPHNVKRSMARYANWHSDQFERPMSVGSILRLDGQGNRIMRPIDPATRSFRHPPPIRFFPPPAALSFFPATRHPFVPSPATRSFRHPPPFELGTRRARASHRRAGQAFEFGERSVPDRTTTNSLAANRRGSRQIRSRLKSYRKKVRPARVSPKGHRSSRRRVGLGRFPTTLTTNPC